MKRLEQMKDCLISCVQNQINGHLNQVDTKELGEAIDMIKDLEEAIYYATITKAMHEEESNPYEKWEHENKKENRMYYEDKEDYSEYGRGTMMGTKPMRKYSNYMPMDNGNYEHDYREGSSPMYRRMYMENKESSQDATKNMQDLENYAHELTKDIMDMIETATAEEKQMLRQKITTLAAKIK